jgi:hypothetical protein
MATNMVGQQELHAAGKSMTGREICMDPAHVRS